MADNWQLVDNELFQLGIELGKIYPLNEKTEIYQTVIRYPSMNVSEKGAGAMLAVDVFNEPIHLALPKIHTVQMTVRKFRGRDYAIGYSEINNTIYISPFWGQWEVR